MNSNPEPASDKKERAMNGAELIAAERQRQIDVEGWKADGDALYRGEELVLAACSYAMSEPNREMRLVGAPALTPKQGADQTDYVRVPRLWPWRASWWKPTPDDRVRELVKAGALIAAEIDRLTADV